MKPHEDEPCPITVLLSEDDGAVICAAGQALVAAVMALRMRVSAWRISRRGRYRGSLPGLWPNKQRDFDAGLNNIVRDYFGVYGQDPVYNEHDFETRSRVPRAVFRRVYSEVKDTPFFRRQIKATGRPQAHPLQKVIAAFRVLAYGEAADRADEYVRLSRSTILLSVKCLVVSIVSNWESTCLRRPNNAELKTILDRNAERGFPGCWARLIAATGRGTGVPEVRRVATRSERARAESLWRLCATRTCGFGTCLSAHQGASTTSTCCTSPPSTLT